MIFTALMNDGKHCFVFGSNESGNHCGGAAFEAFKNWGAVLGIGFGPQGSSFASPTMDWAIEPLPLPEIRFYVNRFIAYANRWPEYRFLVTPIGTGICGYKGFQIAPMFADAPTHCVLPEGWRE